MFQIFRLVKISARYTIYQRGIKVFLFPLSLSFTYYLTLLKECRKMHLWCQKEIWHPHLSDFLVSIFQLKSYIKHTHTYVLTPHFFLNEMICHKSNLSFLGIIGNTLTKSALKISCV